MFIFRRIILFLVPIAWLVGLELTKNFPSGWWIVLAASVALTFISIWLIGLPAQAGFQNGRTKSEWLLNKNLWNLVILPIILILSSFGIALVIVNNIMFQVLAVASALSLYFLLRQYDLYFNAPYRYQPYSLESLSWYVGLLCAFCLASAGFSGLILLQFNIGIILAVIAPLFGLLIYQFFWVHKVPWKQNWFLVLIIVLTLIELFVVFSFLPTGHYVNGLFLLVAYYLMLGFAKLDISGALNRKNIAYQLIISVIVLLAVIFTAQWQ